MTDKYKEDDYIIYRYSTKDYPFLSYVGKKLARRDKARDKQHREAREISAFHGFIHNAKEAVVSFDDLLEYPEIERIYCTDREARIREDFWIGRFDSINDGLNSVLNYPEISSYKDWEHEWHNKGLLTPPMIRLRVTEKRHVCIWLSKLRVERDERYNILRRITQNMLQVIKEGGRGIR